MADETPEQRPAEELKKDTVRINLPPGLTGRGATPRITPPTPAPSNRPPGPPVSPEEEAKKETAVMGRPAEAPKPKKDTSRVQVTAAKPAMAESPRPTVKLRQDAAPATAGTSAAAAPAARPAMAGVSDGGGGALSLVAMVLSIAVAGYLAFLAFG